ncbi:MAG: 2,3-diphosphoglycerate-dependent phosphoglycerate mutase [Candidatus Humimicrobiaceae bacterium]
MYTLVLLRHGESIWNKENRFTGWTDVDLSKKGIEEAKDAAYELKKAGFSFDLAFTSLLKRSIRTLWIHLEYMDLMWIPVYKSWHLNERFYGALQGLNKQETSKKYGELQVKLWRRGYDICPPAINKNDPRFPGKDPKYTALSEDNLPLAESLKDAINRILPYWNEEIVPEMKLGKKILIVAHGNSLRGIIKHIDNISSEEIINLNIPLGIPLIYEFDNNLKPINHYYLGGIKKINKAIEMVSKQHIIK